MPRRCFAPGCNSGYDKATLQNKKNGLKNPSLFSAPKDAALLEKWNKAIPRKDKDIRSTDAVCELHFADNCIERNFVTKLVDGTDFVLEREKPFLKTGSIPTLFPNLPAYFSTRMGKTNEAKELPLTKKKSKGMPSTTIEADVPSTTIILEDFLISNKSEDFSEINDLESVKKNNFSDSHDELQSICTNSYSTPDDFNESPQIKYVTHLEALFAAKTLLHYLINQDDVNNADISFILSVTKKIKSKLSNSKEIKTEIV